MIAECLEKKALTKSTNKMFFTHYYNPLSADFTKWPNAHKQFVGKLPTNCLSVFGHFLGLTLKRLKEFRKGLNEDIFTEVRKVIGFKSLQLNCSDIT